MNGNGVFGGEIIKCMGTLCVTGPVNIAGAYTFSAISVYE